MPLPGSAAMSDMFAVGLAAATEGPSTADVAAEVIRQLQSQSIVMRGADQQLGTCPSDHAIPPASVQPAISRVVDQLTGEERQHDVSSISQLIDIHVEKKLKHQYRLMSISSSTPYRFHQLPFTSQNNTPSR